MAGMIVARIKKFILYDGMCYLSASISLSLDCCRLEASFIAPSPFPLYFALASPTIMPFMTDR